MQTMKFVGLLLSVALSGNALGDKDISLNELRKHNTEADCWMAINGSVYNMTEFIKLHAEECKKIKFADYCGSDASETWKKKEAGDSPHKKKSYRGLEKAKIGRVSTS